jgi:hypothetical protein
VAKSIPKKKSVVTARLAELDALASEREKWVDQLRESSGDNIDEILGIMVENLQRMQGPPRLIIDGQIVAVGEQEFKLLQSIQLRNFQWIAMRCLVACAEWGIKIGSFGAPKHNCIRCGKKVK